MRALTVLCLAVVGCTHIAPEGDQTPATAEPKPAIRAHIVPGATLGNIALQTATVVALEDVFTAKTESPECFNGQMKVSDTWPLGEPAPSKYSNAFTRWRELWTIEMCRNSVDVEIVYMLHRQSGIINVKVLPVQEGQSVELS